MARPAEKARAMLNKWVALKERGNEDSAQQRQRQARQRRPNLASECEHLADAERYRGQIVREISDAIAKIQSPALGEHEMRELNDKINQLMRTKYHWNKRIQQLGGLDFNAIERKRRIEEGDAQLDSRYRYYGAAKDLPGVKELLEKEEKARHKIKRADLYKHITPDYYGWRDEEDGVLLELEEHATKQLQKRCKQDGIGLLSPDDVLTGITNEQDYLDVTSQEDIAKILLEQKKKALMVKYAL